LDLPAPSTPETQAAVEGLMSILEEDPAPREPSTADDSAPSEEQPAPSSSVVSKHSAHLTCRHLVYLQETIRKEMEERMDTLSSSFNAKIDGLMRLLQARLPPAE
jgi:hypothetical protein